MRKERLMKVITNGIDNNVLPEIVQYCSANVCYVSGKTIVKGKDKVYDYLKSRQKALKDNNVKCFGYEATVKKTVGDIKRGDRIVAVAQFDKFNCVGYFTIKKNLFGKLTRIKFNTDSTTEFTCDCEGGWNISHVPKDAHDAIGYRAFAFKIMDEHIILSKHVQRYDEFQCMIQDIYEYIVKYLVEEFNQGITNIAGYLYVSAMITALNRQKEDAIKFKFSPTDAANGIIPTVPDIYKLWIHEGYEMGKKLFLGFIEYVNLKKPKDDIFVEQLMQSFMDMCLYGSTQTNKDVDLGRIEI